MKQALDNVLAWVLGAVWLLPLLYAIWTAFHPAAYEAHFSLTAPLTLENFARAWESAPFARYFLNTIALVITIVGSQMVLCTLAAFAFARLPFRGLLLFSAPPSPAQLCPFSRRNRGPMRLLLRSRPVCENQLDR